MGKTGRAHRAHRIAALAGVSFVALTGTAFPQSVDGVTVQAQRRAQQLDRLPQPIEDQPQTVHVIDEEQLRAQAATSLDFAIRNVPGITSNTGEGGGAVSGDQFRIRGFDAQNDIASDGLRDFGVYTRDTFNTESVQIFLGPSGTTFGRGSFGGAINTTSKFARGEADFTTLQGSVGTGDLVRGIVDLNRTFGGHSAGRLNLMMHHNAVDGIDQVESDRFGLAGALGFGIGTKTTFDLMFFHQQDDRVPYYGVPVVARPGETIARPLPAPRDVFYGTEHDLDETMANVLTAKFSHEFSEGLRIANDTRVGFFERDFMAVAPNCNGACPANFFDGDPSTIPLVARGGSSAPYSMDQWGVQNITTLVADFDLGIRHQLVAGVDLMMESSNRLNRSAYQPGGATFPRPTVDANNPDPSWANPVYIDTNERRSDSTTAAFFLSDQMWFTDQLSLLLGVRWDQYNVESELQTWGTVNNTTGVFTAAPAFSTVEADETLFSPRASLVWEPDENTMFYVSWARSEQPPTGTAIASVGTPVADNLTDIKPTTSETIEAGARFPLFSPNLLASVAVFRIERDNAKETDPTTGGILASGDQQEATGFEIGLDGQITDRWSVQASYTYLDTETVFATQNCSTTVGAAFPCGPGVPNGTSFTNPAAIGNPIPFAAENAATLWTTYQVTDALQIGGGVRYTDEVWLNNTNTAQAPEYFSLDALVSYEFGNEITLQLNGTNLTDEEDNFDQVTGGRAAHSPGRAFVVSLTKTF